MTKTTGARVDRSRRKLAAEGGRRLDLRLSPEANAASERLCLQTGESLTGLINRLLVENGKNDCPQE